MRERHMQAEGWLTGTTGGVSCLKGWERLQAEDAARSAELDERIRREPVGVRWAAKVIVQCSEPGCPARATGHGLCDKHRARKGMRLLRNRRICVTTDTE